MTTHKFNRFEFKAKTHQQGVALLEALIALLIFSMGVLALVGLQAAMTSNTTASKMRSDASYLVQQRLGQIWADPMNIAAYVEANTNISNLLPNGTRTVQNLGNCQIRITVTWQAPGDSSAHNTSLEARVRPNGAC